MQGLAFATVSGIPLLYGLYIVWAPPFFYALFGVSLHVSYGPFALMGLFISDALGKRGYQPCDGLCRLDTEETRVSKFLSFPFRPGGQWREGAGSGEIMRLSSGGVGKWLVFFFRIISQGVTPTQPLFLSKNVLI